MPIDKTVLEITDSNAWRWRKPMQTLPQHARAAAAGSLTAVLTLPAL
jgi:hypothetical protein